MQRDKEKNYQGSKTKTENPLCAPLPALLTDGMRHCDMMKTVPSVLMDPESHGENELYVHTQ